MHIVLMDVVNRHPAREFGGVAIANGTKCGAAEIFGLMRAWCRLLMAEPRFDRP